MMNLLLTIWNNIEPFRESDATVFNSIMCALFGSEAPIYLLAIARLYLDLYKTLLLP